MADFDVEYQDKSINGKEEAIRAEGTLTIVARNQSEAIQRAMYFWFLTASFPNGKSRGKFQITKVTDKR